MKLMLVALGMTLTLPVWAEGAYAVRAGKMNPACKVYNRLDGFALSFNRITVRAGGTCPKEYIDGRKEDLPNGKYRFTFANGSVCVIDGYGAGPCTHKKTAVQNKK